MHVIDSKPAAPVKRSSGQHLSDASPARPRMLSDAVRDDDLWSLDRDFPGVDILRAIDLLRSQGYRVDKAA